MTDLVEISIDNIETNIMSILYSNIDIKFSQFSLFNKLLNDKYDTSYTNFIHPNFKAKYLLVLRNLIAKYDDIIITKENKNYYILCVSDKEKSDNCAEYALNMNYMNDIEINVSKYIVDNDIEKEFKYVDPYDGNTIYHDLVLSNNVDTIEKMIKDDIFNHFVFNKKNQTPLELSNNPLMTNIIVMGIYNKILKENEKYNSITSQFKYSLSEEARVKTIENSSIIDIIKIKFKQKYYIVKLLFLLFVIYNIYLRF